MKKNTSAMPIVLAISASVAGLQGCGDKPQTTTENSSRAASSAQGAVAEPVPQRTGAPASSREAVAPQASDAAGAETPAGASPALASSAGKGVFFNLPNGVTIQAPEGGFEDSLSTFLSTGKKGSSQDFTLTDIAFDSTSAAISKTATGQIDRLAAILKAFPGVSIRLEGYAGTSADSASNKKMAEVVKIALVDQGIAAERIAAEAASNDKPGASKDAKAESQHIAVVVTKN